MGANRAKQYLLTGDKLGAQEAERIGLINQVVPADDLLASAQAFAARLANGPQRAIRGTKAAVNALLRDSANMIMDACLATEKECFTSGDHARAVEVFLGGKEAGKR
ncbi:putative enoyl-CoA hydratase echA8 [compost metagenome]